MLLKFGQLCLSGLVHVGQCKEQFELFQQWRFLCTRSGHKALRNLSLFASVWKIWIERNNSVFRNKSSEVDEVVDSIIWAVSCWASRSKGFAGVNMHDLNMSWSAYF